MKSIAQPLASENRRAHSLRIALYFATLAASWIAGIIGAFLVWNFIYSIGARVIEDETYERLQNVVIRGGGFAAAVAVLWTFVCLRRPAPIILFSAAAIATFAGFVGGMIGWRIGLYAHFGSYAALMIYVFFKAIVGARARAAA